MAVALIKMAAILIGKLATITAIEDRRRLPQAPHTFRTAITLQVALLDRTMPHRVEPTEIVQRRGLQVLLPLDVGNLVTDHIWIATMTV